MKILFQNDRLRKEFNNSRLLVKRYGAIQAKLIQRRLAEIHAADRLEDLRSLPQARYHQLRENRAEQISADVEYPYRLIFVCANDPVPRNPDGGLDWTRVTAIVIIGVENTHD
ncbi:MAG: type II toxin-antitoxin system RelE/ParE family toxin [Chloroflexi bacterium]|nr:type II toxin-antitoxin system RelE/ParE family toxin [Chloroflexota bacterium]